MTEDRDFKRIVRSRAERTGESYQAAWRQLSGSPVAHGDRGDRLVLSGVLGDDPVRLRMELVAALRGSQQRHVVVDCAAISRVTTDGVGVLAGVLKRARVAQIGLVIDRPSRPLLEALGRFDLLEDFELTSPWPARAGLVPRDLGGRLRQRRLQLGLSRQEVGARTELTALKVDLLERGEAAVSAVAADALVVGLDLEEGDAAALRAAAGIAAVLRQDEHGDPSMIPALAGADGFWIASSAVDGAWIDVFAVDGQRLFFPLVALTWDDVETPPGAIVGDDISIEVAGGVRWAATRVDGVEALRHRGAELLGNKYSHEGTWFEAAPVVVLAVHA